MSSLSHSPKTRSKRGQTSRNYSVIPKNEVRALEAPFLPKLSRFFFGIERRSHSLSSEGRWNSWCCWKRRRGFSSSLFSWDFRLLPTPTMVSGRHGEKIPKHSKIFPNIEEKLFNNSSHSLISLSGPAHPALELSRFPRFYSLWQLPNAPIVIHRVG